MRSLKIDEQRKNMMNINSFIDFFFFSLFRDISWNKKYIMKIQTDFSLKYTSIMIVSFLILWLLLLKKNR